MFVNLEYKAQAETSCVFVEQFGREISLELFWPKFFFQLPVSNRRKSSIFKKVMSMVIYVTVKIDEPIGLCIFVLHELV